MDILLEKTFNGKKELKYIFKKNESSSGLVIVFSAFAVRGGKPLYNYVKTIEGLEVNQLFILDQYGADPVGSYYIGEDGDKSIEESVVSLINNICADNNIKRSNIITVGSSKGGFAAIYFALKYGFRTAISGGPQIFLGNYLLNESSAGLLPGIYISGGRGEKHKEYLDNIINEALDSSSTSETEILIHVGCGDPVYKNHVIPFCEALKQKNICYKLDVADYNEHNDLIKYFPSFIVESINKLTNQKSDLTEKVTPYSTEVITTNDGISVYLRNINYYNHKSVYLNNDKMNVESWAVSFENGIPINTLKNGEMQHNVITISHYGLQHYSLYMENGDIESKEKFLNVCDFLVNFIDENGGFPFLFKHHFHPHRLKALESGWYSAMGQGMAISNLTRAYIITGESKYIEVAKNALQPFTISSESGGVLTHFDGSPFYEEYPTNPSSYVLNGFIYSLLGLYDLYATENNQVAKILFEDGVKTLRRIIGLYDLGDRTAYDLSHYSVEGFPPQIARWQYHTTHIHLVMAIYTITKDPVYKDFIDRWVGYLRGEQLTCN